MSREWLPYDQYQRKIQTEALVTLGGAGLILGGMMVIANRTVPPVTWRFRGYVGRFTLFIAVPFLFIGMAFGALVMWPSLATDTSAHSLRTHGQLAVVLEYGLFFGGLGQVVAVVAAAIAFLSTAPTRALWSDHRAAGWTAKQCRIEWERQRAEGWAQKAEEERLAEAARQVAAAQAEADSAARQALLPPPPAVR
jgi:hypothetical protein